MTPGDVFGRLTVINQNQKDKRYFDVECDCGTFKKVRKDHLVHKKIVSCGCFAKESASIRNKTHGSSGTPEYTTWHNMIHRCENKTDKRYHDYGGRGIKVCDRWKVFELFFEDMGKKPFIGAQIDRNDNNGNYNKENCLWVTRSQNQRNMRSNKIITYKGESAPLIIFSERFGINHSTLRKRISRGWSVERAIETVLLKEKVKK